jgi:hypothetical protein
MKQFNPFKSDEVNNFLKRAILRLLQIMNNILLKEVGGKKFTLPYFNNII